MAKKKEKEVLGYSGYSRVIDDEQLKDIAYIKKGYENYMDAEIEVKTGGVRVGGFDFSLKSTDNNKYLMEISCSYRVKKG